MLNDTLKSGCQTKWKCIIILFFGAVLTLTGAVLEQGQFRYHGKRLSLEGTWTAREEVAANLSYDLGGNTLLLGTEEFLVPCGIDGVMTGENALAVITGGSGVLTRTAFYDLSGEPLGRLDLRERAMLRGIFLDSGFLGLCYGKDGCWSLVLCGTDGDIRSELTLEAQICYGILSLGTGFVVETEDALLFYDQELVCLNKYLMGSREVTAWVGENDLLAVVFSHQGENKLSTFSPEGELLGEEVLPMECRDLEISGYNVCVLDFESLRVYDAFCNCYAVSSEGGRALSLEADTKGLWLLGEGEAMYLKS